MKFTLTYDGELPASGNKKTRAKEKWDIRRKFHPQLADLWEMEAALKRLKQYSKVPKGGAWMVEQHHSLPEPAQSEGRGEFIDTCAPIKRKGRKFIPLVRDSLATVCELNILFLRKDDPGKVLTHGGGGDLDNRLKTLLDALKMPGRDDDLAHWQDDDPQPLLCLLEDDALVSGLAVQTGRLLTRPGSNSSEVTLVVGVTVKVTQVRYYNMPLLG